MQTLISFSFLCIISLGNAECNLAGEKQAAYGLPLITSPSLEAIGYRYHPAYQIFICVSCKASTRPQNIRSHLKEKHQSSITLNTITSIIEDHPPHSGLHPALPLFLYHQPAFPIPILPIKTGLQCLLCPFSTVTPGSLRNHFTNHHKGASPNGNSATCSVQTIYTNGVRCYFAVQDDTTPPHFVSNIYTTFLHERQMEEREQQTSALLAVSCKREVSPFIKRLGWEEHVMGYRPADLTHLVSLPTQKPEDKGMRRIREWIIQYLGEVQEKIQKSPQEYLLRLLNSETLEQ